MRGMDVHRAARIMAAAHGGRGAGWCSRRRRCWGLWLGAPKSRPAGPRGPSLQGPRHPGAGVPARDRGVPADPDPPSSNLPVLGPPSWGAGTSWAAWSSISAARGGRLVAPCRARREREDEACAPVRGRGVGLLPRRGLVGAAGAAPRSGTPVAVDRAGGRRPESAGLALVDDPRREALREALLVLWTMSSICCPIAAEHDGSSHRLPTVTVRRDLAGAAAGQRRGV